MDAVLIKPLTQKDLRNLLQEQRAIGLNMQEIRAMERRAASGAVNANR
ncbi:hypothetical protein [Serratia odorifera]|nr:hypothetical protein [Serratia odorifera]